MFALLVVLVVQILAALVLEWFIEVLLVLEDADDLDDEGRVGPGKVQRDVRDYGEEIWDELLIS